MKEFSPVKHYPNLLSNIRCSPSKKAVDSLERIKRRRKGNDVIRGMIDIV